VVALAPLPDSLGFGDVAADSPDVAPDVLVAAASSGMPVWPAAFLVDQAPLQLLTAELRTVSDNVP
jgi:hypothetical protein